MNYILGGSRGLGAALADKVPSKIFSRTKGIQVDFSKKESVDVILENYKKDKPSKIFYVAGGGPHGHFPTKSFKSHQWAYDLNYLTPLQLLFSLQKINFKGDFVYIGSAIAERSQAFTSLSYAQSKKMAKQSFLTFTDFRVFIFSPPYMDTGLLPPNSWPRKEYPELVVSPVKVATVLLDWLSKQQNGSDDKRHFDWIQEFDYIIPKEKEREI